MDPMPELFWFLGDKCRVYNYEIVSGNFSCNMIYARERQLEKAAMDLSIVLAWMKIAGYISTFPEHPIIETWTSLWKFTAVWNRADLFPLT